MMVPLESISLHLRHSSLTNCLHSSDTAQLKQHALQYIMIIIQMSISNPEVENGTIDIMGGRNVWSLWGAN